jgi:hypothetical protein
MVDYSYSDDEHEAIYKAAIEDSNRRATEWETRFPNHCRHCGGWGGFAGWQSVPYGSTSAYLPDYDTCLHCVEENRCPRCFEEVKIWEEDTDQHCPYCDWDPRHADGSPRGDTL